MSEIYLSNGQKRLEALEAIKQAKLGSTIKIERTRTLKQNARYWGNGVLAQIARKASVNGKRFSAESWHEHFKRLFIGIEEMPDGSVRGKSSKELEIEEFAKFAQQVEAYAVTELGVVFVDEREGVEA